MGQLRQTQPDPECAQLPCGAVSRTYRYGLELINERQSISGTPPTSFYGFDGHGSVRFLTSSTGAVTDTYDYDAFGKLISQSDATDWMRDSQVGQRTEWSICAIAVRPVSAIADLSSWRRTSITRATPSPPAKSATRRSVVSPIAHAPVLTDSLLRGGNAHYETRHLHGRREQTSDCPR